MDGGKAAARGAAVSLRHRARGRCLVVGASAAGDHRARRQERRRRPRAPARCERRALSRHPGEPRPRARRSSGRGRRSQGGRHDRRRRGAADRTQARLPARLRLAGSIPARKVHSHRRYRRRADRQPPRPAGDHGLPRPCAAGHGGSRRQSPLHCRRRLGRRAAPQAPRAHGGFRRCHATAKFIPARSSTRSARWPIPITSPSRMAAIS
jgi:hypothetical protein